MTDKSFLLILMAYLLCSCGPLENSSNDLIQESINDKGKKALLFIKYGDATVDNSLHLSIVKDTGSIGGNATGNIFIADDSSGSVRKHDVKFLWRHSDTLEVSYTKRLRIFKSEQQLESVTILYRQVE